MTDYSWISSADGDWSDSGAWNPTGVPSAGTATATIDASGTYTVEIAQPEGFAVDSVTLNSAGATLAVDGTLSLSSGFSILAGKGITGAGSLFVTGGSIGGGTVSVGNQEISGTVALSANLMDTGTVSLGFANTDTLALNSHVLTLTGAGSIIAGKLTGAGTLALAGGDQRVDDGASLGMAKLSTYGPDSLSFTSSMTYAGTFVQGQLATLNVTAGKALTLTGSATLLGAVNGSVNVNGGSLTLDTAGSGAKLALSNSSLSLLGNLTYAGGLSETGGSIALGGKALTVTGTTNLHNVNLMTAGTLYTKGATTVSGLAVQAGAVLANLGATTVKGQIVLGDATKASQLINAQGATLTITSGQAAAAVVDPAARNAYRIGADATTRPVSVIRNKGRVALSRGGTRGGVRRSVLPLPTQIAVVFQNFSTGTVAVQSGTLEFDAAFTNANTTAGSISVAAGTVLDFNGGGSSTAGAFSVAAGGLLEFSGGTFNLAGGALHGAVSLTGGTLGIGGTAVTVSGAFTQAGGSRLGGAGTLALAGGATFNGGAGTVVAETGSGKTIIQGKATVGIDFALDNGRVLQNDGTLLWTAGNFELGRNPGGVTSGGGSIRNDAGATMVIAGTGIMIGVYAKGTSFINAGTVIKSTSAGNATLAVNFQNIGTVSVSDGTLELAGSVSGSGGSFRITNGSILEVDAALPGTQRLVFGTGGGRLVLNDAGAYGATIAGFGAQTALDVTGFKFSGKPTVSFVEAASKKQGVLTLKDGAQSLKVTLFGQYVAAGFHLAADSGGGTVVTYAAPAAQVMLAAGH